MDNPDPLVREFHSGEELVVRIQPTPGASNCVDLTFDDGAVDRHKVGIVFQDGKYVETLVPGHYAWWRGVGEARVVEVDLRE